MQLIVRPYVPIKKQGKRSKKKHLSKEAFRKIRYKQNMWRVYKHTGKDKDYDAYKAALNAATNEVRKSKRNFEHKLAQNQTYQVSRISRETHAFRSTLTLTRPRNETSRIREREREIIFIQINRNNDTIIIQCMDYTD